jgi:outer membrane immunogenic protein
LNNSFSANAPLIANSTGIVTGTIPVAGTVVTNYTTQIDWFGTVRARIGYLWGNGRVLSYVTGGLAYGEVKINGTNIFGASNTATQIFTATQAFGSSQVNTGWVVATVWRG